MKNTPDISVILPVYNGADYVKSSIQSILDQTYSKFELIIINDGSTDSSEREIYNISDPRIRYVKQENQGLANTLNNGITLARGMFIARQDQDDISMPDRFAKQNNFLLENPNVIAVGSDAEIIDMSDHIIRYQPTLIDSTAIAIGMAVFNPLFHSSVMMRKKIIEHIGGYDPTTCEDYALWSRIVMSGGDLANIPEPLIKYRINTKGLSAKQRTFYSNAGRKARDKTWKRFGVDGPAPVSEWGKIWPINVGNRPNESILYGQLHLQFAKKYRLRGKYYLGIRHWMASFSWMYSRPHPYFYVFLFLLPYTIFERIEFWTESAIPKVRFIRL